MTIPKLIQLYLTELRQLGVSTVDEPYNQFDPATPEQLATLEVCTGRPLTPQLKAWFETLDRALPLAGNYDAYSISRAIKNIEDTQTIDFSQHLTNILSWQDGRFDDGVLKRTYWQPQWVAIAQDSCGNEYCVDLDPGPSGQAGQMIAMEFQDGQGPYQATFWTTLEEMLEVHIAALADQKFELDEEGFIEIDLYA